MEKYFAIPKKVKLEEFSYELEISQQQSQGSQSIDGSYAEFDLKGE